MKAKYKYYLLLAAIALFVLLSYHLAFKKTFHVIGSFGEIVEKIENTSDNATKLEEKRERLAKLEKIIGSHDPNLEFHEQILNVLNAYCTGKRIKITEYPALHEFIYDDYKIQTCTVVLESDFISLLKLIRHLELSEQTGRIVSVSFTKEKNQLSKTEVLKLKIYIQNIKKTSS